MTTPVKNLLDRNLAYDGNREVGEMISAVLGEIVNRSTTVLASCSSSVDERRYVHAAPLSLFHQAITFADGVEELLSVACARAAIPCARSMFEATLELRFILDSSERFERRSLSWYVDHLHAEGQKLDREDITSDAGKLQEKRWLDAHPEAEFRAMPVDILVRRRESIATNLAQPELVDLDQEYMEMDKGRKIAWYTLSDGITSLSDLAGRMNSGPDYDLWFRYFSDTAHSKDFENVVSAGVNGAAFTPIRSSHGIAYTGLNASVLLAEACSRVWLWYRPQDQAKNFPSWYQTEISSRISQLRKMAEADGIGGRGR